MRQILIAALFISTLCRAQDAPRKCTAITISGVNFEQVQNALADAGFFIDRKDTAVHTLITVARKIEDGPPKAFNMRRSIDVVYYIRVKDDVAIITGQHFIGSSGQVVISNSGMKGSSYQYSWQAMNELAGKFGGKVSY